jgi:hypothetical protein
MGACGKPSAEQIGGLRLVALELDLDQSEQRVTRRLFRDQRDVRGDGAGRNRLSRRAIAEGERPIRSASWSAV